ncbi:DsbA family oxidoreductase [Ornithinimicrobium avium]|uniref:Uncharacterized protein n=1 Tax=Ornithinimicrobium avium TaxID=2283195 RepID=A0A345NJW4_9MICO|nr:hypothetical protein [Ornithinimicrobium avium]AXH95322.1 hypothetical protein DV701_03480 [Ornithinimicrobium avium]
MTTTSLDRPTEVGTPQAFYRRHNTFPRFLTPARPRGSGRGGDLALVAGLGGLVRADREMLRAGAGPAEDLPELYVDLTSPWAYLAHLRLQGTGPDVAARWCAVQTDHGRPVAGLRGPGPEQDRVREELAAVRALALDGEELPHDIPPVLPHPRAVAAAYAEGVDLGRGPQVRAALLHAYWVEGRDIGDPEVLRRILPPVLVADDHICDGDPRREFGYVVTPAREPLSDAAYHLLRRWQQRWDELGRPEPLALVEAAGTRTGAAALPAGPSAPPLHAA